MYEIKGERMSDKIQLYSLATPNGQKVSIVLEEMGIEYDAHKIDITEGDQFKPEFVEINPNSKIPAIVDPNGPHGDKHSIMESGAILIYLAEKSGKFYPKDERARSETLQWLFFQMASVGPMFGQFGHFYKYASDKCDHPYPKERYTKETKRLLEVIDKKLDDTTYIAGNELTIADFAIFPWVLCLDEFYEAGEHLDLESFKNISKWVAEIKERPAVKTGLKVCDFDH